MSSCPHAPIALPPGSTSSSPSLSFPAGPGQVGSLPADRPVPGSHYPLNGLLIPEGTPYAH